ncbi:MAG TPA: hypothetical protein VGA85_03560 [Dehalococcoidales bacterium]
MKYQTNDVILLGAGFSRAISSVMPLLIDLSDELRSNIPNVPGDNIEHWMTYLSQSHPWLSEPENLRNKALFLELTQSIKRVLSAKTDEALRQCQNCPLWLQKLLQQCHERRVSIITLNYDTLLESAILSITIDKDNKGKDRRLYLDDIYPVPMTNAGSRRGDVYWAGSVKDSCKLYKLHGSINWYYSGASEATGETIYYHYLPEWGGKLPKDDKLPEIERRYVSDKIPLLVPPVIEKSSYFQHETIRTIWGLAGQAIRSASRIICIGYSLPETDLSFRFFLGENAPDSKVSLYIVNLDINSPGHYKKLLGSSYNIDDQYVGRTIDEQLVSCLFPQLHK